jgi:hypothetical protein
MYNMTAVEWVFDKMLDIAAGNSSLTTQEILEKGREMEREKIKEIYLKGIENYDPTFKRKGGEQ